MVNLGNVIMTMRMFFDGSLIKTGVWWVSRLGHHLLIMILRSWWKPCTSTTNVRRLFGYIKQITRCFVWWGLLQSFLLSLFLVTFLHPLSFWRADAWLPRWSAWMWPSDTSLSLNHRGQCTYPCTLCWLHGGSLLWTRRKERELDSGGENPVCIDSKSRSQDANTGRVEVLSTESGNVLYQTPRRRSQHNKQWENLWQLNQSWPRSLTSALCNISRHCAMKATIGASAAKIDSSLRRTLVFTQLPRRPTSLAKRSWSSRKKANCRKSRSATVARRALFPRCPNFSTVSKHSRSSSSHKSDAGYLSRSDCLDWATDLSRTPWQSKNTPILLMFKGLGGVLGLDEGRGPAVEEDDAATSTDGSGNTGGDLDRPIESAEGLSVPREPEDLIDAISHSKRITGSHVPNALLQLSCVCKETMEPVESCCLFRRRVWQLL